MSDALHVVRDDAVVRERQAGDDGVVIRKRLRRELRNQSFGAHAFGSEPRQRRRRKAIEVIPAKAVDRNQDDDRASRAAARSRGDCTRASAVSASAIAARRVSFI